MSLAKGSIVGLNGRLVGLARVLIALLGWGTISSKT